MTRINEGKVDNCKDFKCDSRLIYNSERPRLVVFHRVAINEQAREHDRYDVHTAPRKFRIFVAND